MHPDVWPGCYADQTKAMVVKEDVMQRSNDQEPDEQPEDRLGRFVNGPGDSIVYGPDGKPSKPGDPIPERRSEPMADE